MAGTYTQDTAYTLFRQAQIARLLSQGYSAPHIAATLRLSLSTVKAHIAKIEAAWALATLESVSIQKARKIAELQAIIRQAWQGWNMSAGITEPELPAELKGADLTAGVPAAGVMVIDESQTALARVPATDWEDLPEPAEPRATQLGDVGYLKLALAALAQQIALQGLEAPKKVMEIPLTPEALESMSVEDLERLQKSILRGDTSDLLR